MRWCAIASCCCCSTARRHAPSRVSSPPYRCLCALARVSSPPYRCWQITKLLPIVCVLTPQPNLDDAPTPSPDPSGKITEALISHLHRTWGEFTNRILGKQAGTPIDDFGVYVGWSSVYQATRDKSSRDRTKVRAKEGGEQLCCQAS
eukprot:6967579-Prymnesium_polylepis.1